MTGSREVRPEPLLTLKHSSIPKQASYFTKCAELVLSSPWEPQVTVALSVSLSQWTGNGSEIISVTVTPLQNGWAEELRLFVSE